MLGLFLILLADVFSAQAPANCPRRRNNHEVVFSWDSSNIQFNWPNETFRRAHSGKRVVPIGIKVFGDKVFMNIPRWYGNGHPANVVYASRPQRGCILKTTSPTLEPFPSWEMNKIGDCNAFQFVASMQIEPSGIAWLPDNGREFNRRVICHPKMVIMDFNSGNVIQVHEFPSNVVSRSGSFLNDITLDISDSDNKFAFISDSNVGAIIVYSLKLNRSWKAEHLTMKATNFQASRLTFINPTATKIIRNNNVNGIASSKAGSSSSVQVFFSPLTSFSVFQVDSAFLKSESAATDQRLIGEAIREYKNKPSQTDGLIMDERNNLYMTEVANNLISSWNPLRSGSSLERDRKVLAQDNTTMIWPDTVAIDDEGFLWATTRGWPIDRNTNAVIRIYIGARSSLH